MRKLTLYSTAKLCAPVLFFSFALASSQLVASNAMTNFRPVSANELADILAMLSTQVRSNYDRVETWRGEMDVEVSTIHEGLAAKRILENKGANIEKCPKAVSKHRRTKIEFAADCNEGLFYARKSRQNPRSYIDCETGRIVLARSVPWDNTSIVTPEYQVNCTPNSTHGDSITGRSAIKKAVERDCASCRSSLFDPRAFLLSGRPVWETFPLVLEYIDKHGAFSVDGHSLKVEQSTDGSITKYRIQIPGKVSPEECLFVTMVFSSANNFNIILDPIQA